MQGKIDSGYIAMINNFIDKTACFMHLIEFNWYFNVFLQPENI